MSEDTPNKNEEKKEDQDQQEQDVEQETTTTTTTTTATTKSEDELFLDRLTEEAEGCDDDITFNDTTTDDLKDLDAIAADFNIDDFNIDDLDDDMDGELEAVYDGSLAMEARERAMAMLRVAEKPPDKRVEVGSISFFLVVVVGQYGTFK